MTNPFPVSPVDRPASEIDYKALSGVAVAALIYSSLYALVIAIIVISALWTRRAALDIRLQLLFLLTLVGVGLSVAGRLHIRRSEGTRTGLKVAAAAWWLSILGGVTFGAISAASTFALQKQSEKAADEWFKLLKEQQVDRAFLLTLSPLQRSDTVDEVRFATPLNNFRSSDWVRFFQRNGADAAVELKGMSNWQQIDKGYRVDLAYGLASPEGVFDLNLALSGTEGKDIVGRQWQINVMGGLTPRNYTAYGRLVFELQDEARRLADVWLRKVQLRMTEQVLSETIRINGQPENNSVLVEKQRALALVGAPLEFAVDAALWDAAFEDLKKRSFFTLNKGEFLTADKEKVMGDCWKMAYFYPAGLSPIRLQNLERTQAFSVTDKGITCEALVDVGLTAAPQGRGPLTGTKAKLALVCDSPEFLKEILQLKAKGKEHPDVSDPSKTDLLSALPARNWRVVRLETNLEKAEPLPPPGPR